MQEENQTEEETTKPTYSVTLVFSDENMDNETFEQLSKEEAKKIVDEFKRELAAKKPENEFCNVCIDTKDTYIFRMFKYAVVESISVDEDEE